MAENTNTPVTMEIINSEQFKRANIRFNGKPAEEIREELKKEGWFYSRNHNVWYPKNDAAANSQNFANHIKETYFPDKQEVKIITEASEKDELVSMVQNGSSLNDILSKLSDMYGEEAVHEAFAEARNGIEAKKETEILKPLVEDADFLKSVDPKALEVAVVNKENGDFIHIQSSDEYGWDYTSYTKDYKEIDGGVSDDVPDSKEAEDIRIAAKAIIKDLYPSSSLSDWSETDWNELEAKIEEIEGEAYQKLVENKEKQWAEHDNGVEQARDEAESREINAELKALDEEAENMERANGLREMEESMPSVGNDETGLTKEEQEIRAAQTKFGDIVRKSFLALSDEEKEAGTTIEQKNTRYEKWFRPMVDEIMTDLGNGNKEAMEIVNNFDMDRKNHVEGNKWYSPDEAWMRDVQYKLLPEMYEKVQDRIKAKYEADKTPYVIMYSSESPHFPSENKVYTVKEFNEKLLQADSEFHNRKKYAEEKYGSADNYWDLERDDKLPEEDKGIQFGYDKTNFKFFNIPSLKNPEDTLSYEPSRYDIGDGNGSVFDYVRSTCSHDEFIEALNALETELYFPGVTDSQREFVGKTVKEEAEILKTNLKEKMEDLDKAQNEYKELHKRWLIESSEAERVDEMLKTALDGIKETYDASMNDVFTKVLAEYPFAANDVSGNEFLKYTANEAKKMAVNELYLPSRNAQKAMNAEDYKTYNSVDWAKLRRIWEMFPANVNMTEYAEKMLQAKVAEKGMSVADTTTEVHEDKHSVTSEPSLFDGIDDDRPEVKDVGKITNENGVKPELTKEEIDICKKVIPPSQFKFTMELTQGEEGEFFTNKMKEIAETYKKINSDKELVNEDGTHTLGFRYFLGDTEIMLSEIDSDGIGFGYNILNGDLQMSEWGSTSLEEIMKIPYMKMDYHTPKNATIEQILYSEHPDYFTEYAPKDNKSPEIDDKGPSKELSWGELEVLFSPASLEGTDFVVPSEEFERMRKEVQQWAEHDAMDRNLTETDLKKETVDRMLWSSLDFHNFMENAEKSGDTKLSAAAHEECASYSEELADLMVKGEITSLENAQIFLNDGLLHSDAYNQVKTEETVKEDRPYNFFVGDTANLNIGFGAEFETITGMTAEQAAVKFAELTDKGFSPFIGLNIPGDRVFDDKESQGAGIFATMEREGIPSFYIGDSFVKELKVNDEHAKNVIAAYKELYEQTNKYIMGVKKPDFVFEKENELNKPSKPFEVYTFSPFGYEDSLVQVETDLRRGIPAYDIVGLADGAVKETRERIRYAFSNSGLNLPSERVLQSLSPADLRKDAPLDLSMAVGILGQMKDYKVDEPVLALGELELSGNIRPVRGAVAAVNTAKASGITNIVCDPETEKLLKDIDGINILSASSLKEARELSALVFEKPKHFVYQPEKAKEVGEKTVQMEAKLDDVNISQSQIKDAEEERKRITEPILNGERTGMYKAFKDFADKCVLDIQGATVKLAKNGGLTPTGWKQLQAAMEIYRSKKFETFRYIMIDRKTGEIADQLAITSHMPNFCNVSKPNDETLKQVISRAEEKDYLIAVCHNHPSGNTTESSFDRELTDSLDRSLRRNDGLNRFAGHIILDHDTFNLAVPSESRPGNCHWKKMEPLQVTEIDRFTAEPKPEWAGNYVGGTSALKEVAKKINDTENWNDEFIPVVFTNADRNISGVQYYSKNFFENESDKIRNEFQFAAMEAGAIGAFPVVTDSLWEKLGKDATDFEAVMKAHVMNDAFTDVAFNHTTMTEKYDIEAGRNYYSFYRDNSDRKIDVSSTWQPLEINPRLFPPEGVGQTNEKDGYNAKMPLRTNPEDTPEYINSKRHKRDLDYER